VVIAEQENTESAVGLLLKIMYYAVTIDQNLVSHFTYDKKVNGFIFCFELFTSILLIFISLAMYICSSVIDQTVVVAYSSKLSVFLSCYSRRIAVGSQVREIMHLVMIVYFKTICEQ